MIGVSLYTSQGVFVSRLPEWSDCTVQQEHNRQGSGSLSIPRKAYGVETLLRQNDGIIRVDEAGHEPFRFLFDMEEEDTASDDPVLRIGGPGEMQILDRAVVYPRYGVGQYPNYSFPQKSPGFIMKTLIDQAHARGAINQLTYDFNETRDSAGNPWRFVIDVNYDAGLSLLQVFTALADNGWCDVRVQNGVVQAYNPDTAFAVARIGRWALEWRAGRTFTAPIVLREERSVIDLVHSGSNPSLSAPFNITGKVNLNVVEPGLQQFRVTTNSGGSITMFVNGNQILQPAAAQTTGTRTFIGSIELEGGVYPVEARYINDGGDARVLVEYAAPGSSVFTSVSTQPSVIVRRAREVISAPRKKQRSTVRTAILVVGLDGKNIESVSPVAGIDRRESFLSDGRLSLESTMRVFGQRTLSGSRTPAEGTTVEIDLWASPYSPRRDFYVGDFIYVDHIRDADRNFIPQRVSTVATAWSASGEKRASLELEDVFLSAEVRAKRRIEGITNGSGSAGDGGGGPPPGEFVDTTIPKAPFAVAATFFGSLALDGSTVSTAEVTWSQVVQNTDNSPYEDHRIYLAGYAVDGGPWSLSAETRVTVAGFDGLRPGSRVQFRVAAVDTNDNQSEWTYSPVYIVIGDVTPPPKPSAPVVTAEIEALRVAWDGLGENGEPMPPDFNRLEVWMDTNVGFSPPLSGTRVDTLNGAARAYVSGLDPDLTYVFKFVAFDNTGNASTPSNGSAPGRPSEFPQTDISGSIIDANQITGQFKTEQFGARTITAEKMVVGLGDNSVEDPGFEILLPEATTWSNTTKDAGPFEIYTAGATGIVNPYAGRRALTYPGGPASVSENAQRVNITSGSGSGADTPGGLEPFYASARIYNSVGGDGRVRITWRNSTGASIGTAESLQVPTGSWQLGFVQAFAPAGAVYANITAVSYGAGRTCYDNFYLKRMMQSEFIVNGGIVARHVTADSITTMAANINRAVINDAMITSMSVGKLVAGNIFADLTVSNRIKTADTGARVELNAGGLFAYSATSPTVPTVAIRSDGSAVFTGQVNASSGFFQGKVEASSGYFYGEVHASKGTFRGDVYAENGYFKGLIYASGGEFAGNITSTATITGGTIQGAKFLSNRSTAGVRNYIEIGNTGIQDPVDEIRFFYGFGNTASIRNPSDVPGSLVVSTSSGRTFFFHPTSGFRTTGIIEVGGLVRGGGGVFDASGQCYSPGNPPPSTGTGSHSHFEYAASNHAHSNYALATHTHSTSGAHTHSEYAPAGGSSSDWRAGALFRSGTNWFVRPSGQYSIEVGDPGVSSVYRTFTVNANGKSFVIDHPTPEKTDSKYLVHFVAEGPTADIFYRGRGKIHSDGEYLDERSGLPIGRSGDYRSPRVEIALPDYFEDIAAAEGRTVQITPIAGTCGEEDCNNYLPPYMAATEVVDGKFTVVGVAGITHNCAEFYWRVDAVRKDIAQAEVEPSKSDYDLHGDGPYTYLTRRAEEIRGPLEKQSA